MRSVCNLCIDSFLGTNSFLKETYLNTSKDKQEWGHLSKAKNKNKILPRYDIKYIGDFKSYSHLSTETMNTTPVKTRKTN